MRSLQCWVIQVGMDEEHLVVRRHRGVEREVLLAPAEAGIQPAGIRRASSGSTLVLEPRRDPGPRRGPGEELRRRRLVAQADEDAAQRHGEEVPAQHAARVDGGAPRPADAARHGQAARREALAGGPPRARRRCPSVGFGSFLGVGHLSSTHLARASIPLYRSACTESWSTTEFLPCDDQVRGVVNRLLLGCC